MPARIDVANKLKIPAWPNLKSGNRTVATGSKLSRVALQSVRGVKKVAIRPNLGSVPQRRIISWPSSGEPLLLRYRPFIAINYNRLIHTKIRAGVMYEPRKIALFHFN